MQLVAGHVPEYLPVVRELFREYADAITAIERGEFPAVPEARQCPNCQCYFVCGV